jgi:hypothetical protein
MLEYAVVAHMADADRAKDFPDDLARAFFAAFFDDLPESLVKPRDLGLGVETFAFSGEVFDRLPHNIAIAVEGDLQPHYFLLDDWLVFSTSARLSKSILAARENADQRLEPPAVESGDLVAFGRFPAELAASYLDHIGKFLGAVTAGGDNVELQGPTAIQFRTDDLKSLIETFPALAEAVRMVDGAEWTTVDNDDLRVTRFRAAFAK